MKIISALFAALTCLGAAAGETAERRMAWAHYVPWYKPENASLATEFVYNYPLYDVVESESRIESYRNEMKAAQKIGVDGFFIDLGANVNRPVHEWDLSPYLTAAEGMEFEVGICLDGYDNIPHLTGEFARMLKTYGNHPNYLRYNGKYVIATYQFFRWAPGEWRQLREGLRTAGYEIFIIANVDPSVCRSIDLKQLEEYAEAIDCAYMFGAPGINRDHPEVNNRILNKFTQERGKLFMPCLHPGYYGAWLKSTNDFYQPFAGLDMMYETFTAARQSSPRWVHLTTWNDLIETALMPMAFTFGQMRVLEYYLGALKGHSAPFTEPELVFAYHREEQPGTLLRIEALNLPSKKNAAVTVRGRLLDLNGKQVFGLAEKQFAPGAFGRTEWLVPTANLVRSPYLVPEFSVEAGDWKRTVRVPAVFFVSSWLQNATTVTVPLSGLAEVKNTLRIMQEGDRLSAAITFDSPSPLKRAILFRNDRPVALFSPGLKKDERLLSCKLFQVNDALEVAVKNGRILRAVKNFEKNGCRWFKWDASGLTTTATPRWAVIGITFAGGDDTELTLRHPKSGKSLSVKPAELAAAGQLGDKDLGTLQVLPEMTLANAVPLNLKSGTLELAQFARPPRAADSFYVRYETMDGKFAFSDIRYPFADGNPVETRTFIETPVNLETWSGPIGYCRRDRSEFLTPEKLLPVRKTRLVRKPLSLLTERAVQYKFDGNGDDALGFYSLNVPETLFAKGGHDGNGGALQFTGRETLPMRYRVWPGSSATISFHLNPAPYRGKPQSVIFNKGWTDGISINLLPDGRIEALRTFHIRENAPTEKKDFERIHGKTALLPGRWTKVEIVADAGTMRLYVDGKFDGEAKLKPVRSIGNCTALLGGGMEGYENYAGQLDELSVSGLSRK